MLNPKLKLFTTDAPEFVMETYWNASLYLCGKLTAFAVVVMQNIAIKMIRNISYLLVSSTIMPRFSGAVNDY